MLLYYDTYNNTYTSYTVQALLNFKDTPNKEHCRNYLPTKDTFQDTKVDFPIVLIHFSPLKSGQPLYSGQITWSQCVLYREGPLYCVHSNMGT